MNRQKGELPVEQTHGQSVLSDEPLQITMPFGPVPRRSTPADPCRESPLAVPQVVPWRLQARTKPATLGCSPPLQPAQPVPPGDPSI